MAFLPVLIYFLTNQPKVTAEAAPPSAPAPAPAPAPPPPEVKEDILGSILTYPVSDLEMSILTLLDEIGLEMSTRDILYHLTDSPCWPHVDRSDLNRCLYRMHDQCIVCMRKENGKPLWSMPV